MRYFISFEEKTRVEGKRPEAHAGDQEIWYSNAQRIKRRDGEEDDTQRNVV